MSNEPEQVVEQEDDDLAIDHEALAGEALPDPWDDADQKDWPNAAPILDPEA